MDSKKKIEAVLLGGALVVTLGGAVLPMDANAQTACSLSTTGAGTTISGDVASFIKVGFNPKCSPNTIVMFAQDAQAFAAQGGSKKGNFVYGATSEGGGGAKQCSTTPVTDAAAAVTAPAAATAGC